MKPLRPCREIGCNSLTDKTYCKEHRKAHEERTIERERERHKHYDKYKRDRRAKQFYGSVAWKRTRDHKLMIDNGLCQHCLKENKLTYATMVDHIIPIRVDWDKRLDINNLQSLCDRCHSRKTEKDKQTYGL